MIKSFKHILLIVLGLSGAAAFAQPESMNTSDSMKLYQLFIEKSTAYKRLPLQLEMEMQNRTNFMISDADTGVTAGQFIMQPGLTYIRFGEVEQIVTDSAALLISEKVKQMFFYPDPAMVSGTLKSFAALNTVEFNLIELANRYVVTIDSVAATAKITLTARRRLPSSDMPTERLELYYKRQMAEPERMITVKRTAIPISREDYESLSGSQAVGFQLIKVDESHFYLAKEQTVTFVYKSIRHEANVDAPASIGDRIKKLSNGQYIGVKDYEQYAITIN